jgi:hypothetical protein
VSAEEFEALRRTLLGRPEYVEAARELRESLRDPEFREELRREVQEVEKLLPLIRRWPEHRNGFQPPLV